MTEDNCFDKQQLNELFFGFYFRFLLHSGTGVNAEVNPKLRSRQICLCCDPKSSEQHKSRNAKVFHRFEYSTRPHSMLNCLAINKNKFIKYFCKHQNRTNGSIVNDMSVKLTVFLFVFAFIYFHMRK